MNNVTDFRISLPPRLAREVKTVNAMIAIYCRDKHGKQRSGLCDECRQLAQYAEKRLANCPFQQDKPTCGNCTIHCYKPEMKKRIKAVMRYSGPRMMIHHPFLAITHLLDEKLLKPPRQKKSPSPPQKSGDQQA